MPVIRGAAIVTHVPAEQRAALLRQLSEEREGQSTERGPVIFEIPLQQPGKIDVLVVWQAWEAVPAEVRSEIILEAYRDQQQRIAQALGVTYLEAMEQQLLPYAIVPMIRQGELSAEELRRAMLAEGGILHEGGKSTSASRPWRWPRQRIRGFMTGCREGTGPSCRPSVPFRKINRTSAPR